MTVYKGRVLTLRCGDFSETSQVVSLLSREAGCVRCLAKGSKRPRNPFGGPLDRWTLGQAVWSLRDPNRLGTLMELYEQERFDGLRANLPAFFGASGVTEMILALVPEVEPQPEAFDLAVETFRHLAESHPAATQAITFAFAWRLVAVLGYGGDLAHCAGCGAALAMDTEDGIRNAEYGKPDAPRPPPGPEAAGPPRPDPGAPFRIPNSEFRVSYLFSGALGGLLCPACRAPDPTVRLTLKAVRAARFLATMPWDEVRRVRLARATADAMRQALRSRIAELAGQQLLAVQYV